MVVNCEGLPWLFAAGSPVFDSYLIIADWNQLSANDMLLINNWLGGLGT